MVPSLPLLSCESSVSVKENPDRKKIFFSFDNLMEYHKINSQYALGNWKEKNCHEEHEIQSVISCLRLV